MSFDISKLHCVDNNGQRNIYTYDANGAGDSLATVLASGYFGQDSSTGQEASNMLQVGDEIRVQATDGFAVLRVDTISGTTVTTEMGFGESKVLTMPIMDLSASGGNWLAAPFDGLVRRIKLVTNGEVDTTTVVTVKKSGTGLTGGSISIDQSGQGAGEVYETTATGGNDFAEGDAIEVSWDGGATAQAHATEPDAMLQVEYVPN